jgi:hypothetical protein
LSFNRGVQRKLQKTTADRICLHVVSVIYHSQKKRPEKNTREPTEVTAYLHAKHAINNFIPQAVSTCTSASENHVQSVLKHCNFLSTKECHISDVSESLQNIHFSEYLYL